MFVVAQHVLRARKQTLLVQRRKILVHVLIVQQERTELALVLLPQRVLLVVHVLRARKPPLLVQQRQILVHVLIVKRGGTEPGLLTMPRHVLPAITKLVAVFQLVPQGRAYLLYVRPGLPVIPVDAHLVLLGQIIQVLPTKPNAHLSRRVVRR